MSTAVATSSPQRTLRDLLEKSKNQIALALPTHMTAERMIRVAMTAFMKNPQLQQCTAHSIVACVVQSSELGLELTGPLGHAYMVPYYNKNTRQKEAQFQVGYRGLIDLAFRSGKVLVFSSRCVYANDRFKVRLGTDPRIDHEPTMGDPGEVTAVYSVVKTINGGCDFEVMSSRQIEDHRKQYSKQRDDSAFNPWNTAWEAMAMKTPMRRLAKRVPLSVELVKAAVMDEYAEAGIDHDAIPVIPEDTRASAQESLDRLNANPERNGNGANGHDNAQPPGSKEMAQKIRKYIAEHHPNDLQFAANMLKSYHKHDFGELTASEQQEVWDGLNAEPAAAPDDTF